MPVDEPLDIKKEFRGFLRDCAPDLRVIGERLQVFRKFHDVWKDVNFNNPLSIGMAVVSSVSDALCQVDADGKLPTDVVFPGFKRYSDLAFGNKHFISTLFRSGLAKPSHEHHYDVASNKCPTYNGAKISKISEFDDFKIIYMGTADEIAISILMRDTATIQQFASQSGLWSDCNYISIESGEEILPTCYDSRYIDGNQYDRSIKLIKSGFVKSLLIVGPSGVGKTSMGCEIAKSVFGPNHKILYLGKNFIYSDQAVLKHRVIRAIDMFTPDVVLIDDVQDLLKYNDSTFLSMIEEVRRRHLLIATYMMDKETDSLYIPGLRPGRFDDIIELQLPDMSQRKAIIGLYANTLTDDDVQLIAQSTERFTGAYLKAVTERVSVIGMEFLQQEITNIRKTLPTICSAPQQTDTEHADTDDYDLCQVESFNEEIDEDTIIDRYDNTSHLGHPGRGLQLAPPIIERT